MPELFSAPLFQHPSHPTFRWQLWNPIKPINIFLSESINHKEIIELHIVIRNELRNFVTPVAERVGVAFLAEKCLASWTAKDTVSHTIMMSL